MTRRDLLRLLGAGAGAALGTAAFSACGVGGGPAAPNGASEVSGGFDWRKAAGTTIRVLQTPHPYQLAYQPLLKEFTELTGIEVVVDLVPEADYFTKLNTELAGGTGRHDAFMLGAYFIWQYGPPNWLEDLQPWLENSAATAPDYDFEDVFEGLRTSTRWDFRVGSPLGTGGQWALPWGFENNVVCYNKQYFDQRGITRLPDRFDDFVQLAIDLTDRSENRYGIATRGSKSWATIHPGFMTQYTREGATDYRVENGQLVAAMDSSASIDFTRKWIEMQQKAGPTSWTTYDYPQATGDLGDGTAMMVYDADSATYPKNKPGASRMAGNLAWYPGPAGPDGNYATNLWTWCWAMSSRSQNKLAAWLFMQWATGKAAMAKAVAGGTYADPVRASVFDSTLKRVAADQVGYLETFETVIASAKIQFTPQKAFFDTTMNWAVALQDIYGGDDVASRLRSVAKTNTSKVNL
ncbi:extracellular solute-binding protein [Tsukamurella sp. 1534]|uniref:extracellular solute-binding protein n=1 Tax=Tsukamurella sp. 1534 TaxID=1151061 RepID=UPI003528AA1E